LLRTNIPLNPASLGTIEQQITAFRVWFPPIQLAILPSSR
jgi:hypothetical protein